MSCCLPASVCCVGCSLFIFLLGKYTKQENTQSASLYCKMNPFKMIHDHHIYYFVIKTIWLYLLLAWLNLNVKDLTLGVMLFVMQTAKCCCMLSMLWRCCCLVVRRYFCSARAMEGNMAWAASRGSITSPGDLFCSSSCMRRMCVNASSTATTSLGR